MRTDHEKRSNPAKPRRSLPLTRGDCANGPRPCPHAKCIHHLGDLPSGETCTLDLSDRGGMSLDEIAEVFGHRSRETVRLVEAKAINAIMVAALAENPPDAVRQLLDHVEPGWKVADRKAGGIGSTSRLRPRPEPDGDDEIVEDAPTEEPSDPLVDHIYVALLRSHSNRKRSHAAEIMESGRVFESESQAGQVIRDRFREAGKRVGAVSRAWRADKIANCEKLAFFLGLEIAV